jgi:hypothetical protein
MSPRRQAPADDLPARMTLPIPADGGFKLFSFFFIFLGLINFTFSRRRA